MYQEFMTMIERDNFVILDTETTGLDRGAEICDIAIIDKHGLPMLDTLVKTVRAIPPGATAIHGITTADVQNSPTWADIVPWIKQLIAGKDVVTYNAQYDRKMFHYSDDLSMIAHIDWKEIAPWYCAMEAYAEWFGEWSDYFQSFGWKKLTVAISYVGLQEANAHRALGDCEMTYALIRRLQTINCANRFEWKEKLAAQRGQKA